MKRIAYSGYLPALFLLLLSFQNFAQKNSVPIKINEATFNSSMDEFSAVYFHNDLIFVSNQSEDLLIKKDPDLDKPFCDILSLGEDEKIQDLLVKINTRFHEGPICFSPDENTVYFTRNAFVNGKKKFNKAKQLKLHLFSINYKNNAWGEVLELPFNDKSYSLAHPAISSDGKTLFFTSDMPDGNGQTDLYKVQILSNGYGQPENLGELINTEKNEMFPFVSGDSLFFASDRDGGYGGLDIYFSLIQNGKLSAPRILAEGINSTSDDFAYTHYTHGDKVYGTFSSNRNADNDNVYLWESDIKPLKVEVILVNKRNETLKNVIVELIDDQGKTQQFATDVHGKFKHELKRDTYYQLNFQHPDYMHDELYVSTEISMQDTLIKKQVILDDYPVFTIKPVDESYIPIEGMKVEIQCEGKIAYTSVTDKEGISWEFPRTYQRGDSIHLTIDFSKKSYLNKRIYFDMVIEDGGEVVIPREKLVFMRAEEKVEISKFIDLNPIYYDFAKWDIREDAARELNKVIEFLNANPDVSIELSSHTDCRGTYQSNLNLSDKRAKSAADYIRKEIQNPDQIYGKGYGESQPVFVCNPCGSCSDEAHAKNRRTEFTIVKVGN